MLATICLCVWVCVCLQTYRNRYYVFNKRNSTLVYIGAQPIRAKREICYGENGLEIRNTSIGEPDGRHCGYDGLAENKTKCSSVYTFCGMCISAKYDTTLVLVCN